MLVRCLYMIITSLHEYRAALFIRFFMTPLIHPIFSITILRKENICLVIGYCSSPNKCSLFLIKLVYLKLLQTVLGCAATYQCRDHILLPITYIYRFLPGTKQSLPSAVYPIRHQCRSRNR